MNKLKSLFGGLGIIIYYLISFAVAALPVVAIGFNWWLSFIIFFLISIIPFTNIIFWVWSIIVVFNGTHHSVGFWYTLFWIVFIVFVIKTIVDLITIVFDR